MQYVINKLSFQYLQEKYRNTTFSILYFDCANSHHLVLFILPAHKSHVLQHLAIGCFGPFERIYNNISHTFMREHCGLVITRYNVCSIACSAYGKALSPENIQRSFRKARIYPFNSNVVDLWTFKPSEVLQQENSEAVNSEKSPSGCPSAYFAKITAKNTY